MKTRSREIIAELRSGRHFGVFMDDTGSPGLSTPGLHSNRKSWVAVVVPPHQIVEVVEQFPRALAFVTELGLENPEFHFTDIWAGKAEFAKLDLSQRLAIFDFMAEIFATYNFNVLVQTFDPDNSADIRGSAGWLQDFAHCAHPISPDCAHLSEPLAEPKATILSYLSFCWQAFLPSLPDSSRR